MVHQSGYDFNKIVKAVEKSADRVSVILSEEKLNKLCEIVETEMTALGTKLIPVAKMHTLVELALDEVDSSVAKSYRDYRNYKTEFVHIMDDVLKETQSIRYLGDRDNANTDSALVATKRSLIYKKLSRELYQQFFLTKDEKEAIHTGYIYVHD